VIQRRLGAGLPARLGGEGKAAMSKKNKDSQKESQAPPPVEGDEGELVEGSPEDIERDRNDLLARLQRLSADYLNYQKRVQRDIDSAREFANEQLIKDMLPVLDDMERALEAGGASHAADDQFLKGMQLVHDKALETLGKFGLEVIEAKGEPFNPEFHQALMMQPTDEQPPQTVLSEAARGYILRGRTIRPAGVVVAVAPQEQSEDNGDE